MRYCDQLWSILQRAVGRCELKGLDHLECSGVLQGMHIESRTSYELRHKIWNGICGCQGHHAYYTYREGEWKKLCELYLPLALQMNSLVVKQVKIDYYSVAMLLETTLRAFHAHGWLKHAYSKADQKIINDVIDFS